MRKNNKKCMLVILLLLVVGISIGYAALTTTLNINGATKIEKASWDIHFENLVKSDGSVTATTEASIDSTKTLIEYTVTLAEPGDFYEFTVDMVNKGTIDAMISEVLKEGLSSDQEKYIEYTATYTDGVELEEKDYLKVGTKENIKVRVKYREDIDSNDLPTEESAISLSFKVTYVQADETAKEKASYVCVKASTLHEETCVDGGCIDAGLANGTTIRYGSIGTDGNLTSGNAFDCDVNGDGTFDSVTERFYYVADLDSDSNYVVLSYYSHVAGGTVSNTSTFKYKDGAQILYDAETFGSIGPVTAMQELPKTTQWSKVSLSNVLRNIKNYDGTVLEENFSYEGYAARFITYDEVLKACTTLDICNYLFENSAYTSTALVERFWTESVLLDSDNYIGAIYVNEKTPGQDAVFMRAAYGVRPVIEVPKSSILY